MKPELGYWYSSHHCCLCLLKPPPVLCPCTLLYAQYTPKPLKLRKKKKREKKRWSDKAQHPRQERGLPLSGHFSLTPPTPFIVPCCCSQILSPKLCSPREQAESSCSPHGWSISEAAVLGLWLCVLPGRLVYNVSCNETFEGDKDYYRCSYAVAHNLGLVTDSSTAAKNMQCQLSRQTEDSHGKRAKA